MINFLVCFSFFVSIIYSPECGDFCFVVTLLHKVLSDNTVFSIVSWFTRCFVSRISRKFCKTRSKLAISSLIVDFAQLFWYSSLDWNFLYFIVYFSFQPPIWFFCYQIPKVHGSQKTPLVFGTFAYSFLLYTFRQLSQHNFVYVLL